MKYRDTYRIVTRVSRYVLHRDFRYRATPVNIPFCFRIDGEQRYSGDSRRGKRHAGVDSHLAAVSVDVVVHCHDDTDVDDDDDVIDDGDDDDVIDDDDGDADKEREES